MAIQQSKRQSDLEKRLKLVRQQVYGKESSAISYQLSDKTDESYSDITYLKQDLLKILTFSSVAIGTQVILKLNFF